MPEQLALNLNDTRPDASNLTTEQLELFEKETYDFGDVRYLDAVAFGVWDKGRVNVPALAKAVYEEPAPRDIFPTIWVCAVALTILITIASTLG